MAEAKERRKGRDHTRACATLPQISCSQPTPQNGRCSRVNTTVGPADRKGGHRAAENTHRRHAGAAPIRRICVVPSSRTSACVSHTGQLFAVRPQLSGGSIWQGPPETLCALRGRRDPVRTARGCPPFSKGGHTCDHGTALVPAICALSWLHRRRSCRRSSRSGQLVDGVDPQIN